MVFGFTVERITGFIAILIISTISITVAKMEKLLGTGLGNETSRFSSELVPGL